MAKIEYNNPVRKSERSIAELCKGSTRVSESLCLGSIPSSAAKQRPPKGVAFLFGWGISLRPDRDVAKQLPQMTP